MANHPVIGIFMGDPAGIGPEVIAKSLATGEVHPLCVPVVIGSAYAMELAVKVIEAPLTVGTVASAAGAGRNPGRIDVLDPGNLKPEEIVTGQASAACGKATWEWRQLADRLLEAGEVQGVVSAPVNTDALRLAGLYKSYPGVADSRTLNINGPLRIVRFTDHVPARRVPDEVKKDELIKALEEMHQAFLRWGFTGLRIAVAGLNPHAMGEEEEREIAPAVQEAQRRGINAVGPLAPDTVFRRCADGEFDVVLAMTHDQANIAQKTRKLEGTVSIADPSDPRIQINVSHGTAYDIAGKGIAHHESILAAIKLAANFGAGRGLPRD